MFKLTINGHHGVTMALKGLIFYYLNKTFNSHEKCLASKPVTFCCADHFGPSDPERHPSARETLKEEVMEEMSKNKYGPTTGQHIGKPLPPGQQTRTPLAP